MIKKRIKFLSPLALLLVLAAVVTACTAGAGQAPVTAADVIAKMRETMRTTQTSQSTVDLSVTINKAGIKALVQGFTGKQQEGVTGHTEMFVDKLPDSASATIKSWHQSPDKARVEVQASTIPGATGAALVYDGQKAYAYSPSNNTVYTGTPSNYADRIPAELKAMLQSGDLQTQIDSLIDAANINLAGTEKVAGLDAYKLDITPKADALSKLGLPQMVQMQLGLILKDAHVVLWVDTARWIPLKVTVEHPSIGQFTATTTQIDINKPIDASQFVLQVPGGAKTVDLDAAAKSAVPQNTTLSSARDAASKDGWKLLEPSYLPQGATLVGVSQMPAGMGMGMGMAAKGMGGYVLSYSSPSADFTVMESKGQYQGMLGDGLSGVNGGADGGMKTVTVRGVQGKAFSPASGDFTALFWQEANNGPWVAIHGKVSYEDAVKIAEGLK